MHLPLRSRQARSSARSSRTTTACPLTDVDWEGWRGVYGELRPATDEVVAELRARVAGRNATAWTLHEAETGAEIAYTPEHVRASWGYRGRAPGPARRTARRGGHRVPRGRLYRGPR